MILAVITCIGVFEVADYEWSITFWKFETADPIWGLGSKKNSWNSVFLVSITCTGVFEVANYESGFIFWKLKMMDWIYNKNSRSYRCSNIAKNRVYHTFRLWLLENLTWWSNSEPVFGFYAKNYFRNIPQLHH